MLVEIPVIDAPAQRLRTTLNEVDCTLELRHNATTDAWSLSVEIGGEVVVAGLRIVPGVDIVAGYGLDIGKLAVVDWDGQAMAPDRTALPAGRWRLVGYWE